MRINIELDIEPEEIARLSPKAKAETAVVEALTTMQQLLINQDARIERLKDTLDNLGIMMAEQKEPTK